MTDWHDVSVFPPALIASRTVPLALPETMCKTVSVGLTILREQDQRRGVRGL